MPKAGIYARISSDPDGTRLGVQRQIADCQQLAKRAGFLVVAIYEDNDISAYARKPRPAYRRLCADLESGAIDGAIVWHLDRLHRSPRELEDFIALIEKTSAFVRTVTGGDYDLNTSDGRAMARVVGAMARKESEDKSRRLRRKFADMAANGQYSGGGERPYGYTPGYREVIPHEAAVIQEAAHRVLAGESLRSVANDLTARGTATVTGAPWTGTALRRKLMSAHTSGQREYKGDIVGEATWPAILTPTQTLQLRLLLGNPSRRTNRTPRAYPLSGLVQCGVCGKRMVARPKEGKRRYVCVKDPPKLGCGHVHARSEPVEDLVAQATLYRLDSPELVQALDRRNGKSPIDSTERQLVEDRTQLEILATMFGQNDLTLREWKAAKQPVEQRISIAERTLATVSDRSIAAPFVGNSDALRREWAQLDPSRQRAIVGALVESVQIHPAKVPGSRKFDPDRVEIIWKA